MASLPDISQLSQIESAAKNNIAAAMRMRSNIYKNGESGNSHNVGNMEYAISAIMQNVKDVYPTFKLPEKLIDFLSEDCAAIMDEIAHDMKKSIIATPHDEKGIRQHYNAKKVETLIVYESIATAFGLKNIWQRSRKVVTTFARTPEKL